MQTKLDEFEHIYTSATYNKKRPKVLDIPTVKATRRGKRTGYKITK